MTLGEKLKEIRKKFGLSQEQLAEIMNVSRQAITKWESDTAYQTQVIYKFLHKHSVLLLISY